MKNSTAMIIILTLLMALPALAGDHTGGYLQVLSDSPMRITISDTLEYETPADPLTLPAGSYRLQAATLNDRNWYSRSLKAEFEITAGDTTFVDLQPVVNRLIQSSPSEALLLTPADSLIGYTPYILDYNEAFQFLYIEKNGYLRKRIDVSGDSWPLIVTLQKEEELRQAISVPGRMEQPALFKRYLKPGLVVTAVASNWLSFYLKRKADDYYDKYKAGSDPNRIDHYYNRTEQFDLYSSVMLGVSTAATATFFYFLLTD